MTTDRNGRFTFTKLHSGKCVFQAGKDVFACRVWQFDVAPPKSLTSIAMVNSEGVVRGNGWIPSPGALLPLSPKGQLGLGLLALGGIGVAIAVSQDDDAS